MLHDEKLKIAGFVVIILVAGFFFSWSRAPVELRLVELAQPKGFRTLILDTQSSRLNPFFDISPNGTQSSSHSELSVCDGLYRDQGSPVFGAQNAKISIVEFFDYRCPYCKELMRILEELEKEKGIRLIYKEWPILSEGSKLAARAALGAAAQGKYKEFHSQLMNSRLLTTNAYVKSLAKEHGLDPDRLLSDMSTPGITATLQRNATLASELGIIGTPALVVGRTIVQGAISKNQLERLIDIEASIVSPKVC